MKKNRGFTLAELLIVVAIIAVLVAISIPIFTSQLEKSREAADLANIRSQYAVIQSDIILDEYNSASDYRVQLKQSAEGWQSFESDAANSLYKLFDEVKGVPSKGGAATIHYNPDSAHPLLLSFEGGTSVAGITNGFTPMTAALKNFFTVLGEASAISCWDSTYNVKHDGIDYINSQLKGQNDIKSWAVINSKAGKSGNNFPYNNATTLDKNKNEDYFNSSEKDLYYLWTGVDIQQSNMVGKDVPVMVAYTDANGKRAYAVSNVKVTNGDSSNYNVITGAKGARPGSSAFDLETHLKNNRTDYGSYEEAYAEYQDRLNEFGKPN